MSTDDSTDDLSYLWREAPPYPCGACGGSLRAIGLTYDAQLDPTTGEFSEQYVLGYRCESCQIDLDVMQQPPRLMINKQYPAGHLYLTPHDEAQS